MRLSLTATWSLLRSNLPAASVHPVYKQVNRPYAPVKRIPPSTGKMAAVIMDASSDAR
jgi:hypothetical protein